MIDGIVSKITLGSKELNVSDSARLSDVELRFKLRRESREALKNNRQVERVLNDFLGNQ